MRALRSVVEHPPGVPVELLLVDNASSDGTAAAARDEFPQVPVIELRAAGRAAGFVNWFYAGTEITHYCGVSVNSRWKRRQVADLAINNMYIVVLGHWGPFRRKCYFAAETFGALTDVALSGRRAAGGSAVAYRREAWPDSVP